MTPRGGGMVLLVAAAIAALAPRVVADRWPPQPAGAGAHAVQVPLKQGLTLSYASSITGEPDYESLVVVERVDSDAVQLRTSWNRGDRRWRVFRRPLSRRERERGRAFYFWGKENDTLQYRGYAFAMGTAAVLADLKRTGEAEVALLVPEITPRAPYRGTLTRVGSGAEPFSVVLDSRRVSLPGIRARGILGNPTAAETRLKVEFIFLDDPATPWYLDSRIELMDGRGGRKLLVRIGSADVQQDLVDALRSRCVANINEIYFATGSAEVDSASTPAIQRIAQALSANASWQVTLVGHTDSIGSADTNLDLSRRRAEAVRSMLIRDHRITAARLAADGRGETVPLEDNGSPAGRARNRRVELKRKCN